MSQAKLKPCPFCGNVDMDNDEGCFPVRFHQGRPTAWEVRCGNPSCFAFEAEAGSREIAIEKWNRRYAGEALGPEFKGHYAAAVLALAKKRGDL